MFDVMVYDTGDEGNNNGDDGMPQQLLMLRYVASSLTHTIQGLVSLLNYQYHKQNIAIFTILFRIVS